MASLSVSGSSNIGLADLYHTAVNGESYAERTRAEDKLISELTLVLREVGRESKSIKDLTNHFTPLRNKEIPLITRINNLAQSVKNFKWPVEFAPNENANMGQLNTFFESVVTPVVVTDDEKKESPIAPATSAPTAEQSQYGFWDYVTQAVQWVSESTPVVWITGTTPSKEETSSSQTTPPQ